MRESKNSGAEPKLKMTLKKYRIYCRTMVVNIYFLKFHSKKGTLIPLNEQSHF
jgi:hypothetical protein